MADADEEDVGKGGLQLICMADANETEYMGKRRLPMVSGT